ncbi:hypothetical protein B0H13DRAFT_1979130 [Mycena leptocephala]|nr:hypothetical protein B0H13DRAFT_1979130 [Mycena leptocephala]
MSCMGGCHLGFVRVGMSWWVSSVSPGVYLTGVGMVAPGRAAHRPVNGDGRHIRSRDGDGPSFPKFRPRDGTGRQKDGRQSLINGTGPRSRD